MRRKSFSSMECPIARGLEHVGEWWSILILREAIQGSTRFDQFQRNLGIATNMLSRRLDALVESGLLSRRRYSEKPPRDEYIVTQRGLDFNPVIVALLAWGNRHFAPDGIRVELADTHTGRHARPVLIDGETGFEITPARYKLIPGPAASERVKRRYAENVVKRDRRARTRPDSRSE
jgi:DNA-binding HxlR family transcriptional regulator